MKNTIMRLAAERVIGKAAAAPQPTPSAYMNSRKPRQKQITVGNAARRRQLARSSSGAGVAIAQ